MSPRLIKVASVSARAKIVVESKSYITVRIDKDMRAPHVYWHLVDPEFSLLELGFEWPSGRLVHCSVPLFNGEVEMAEVQSPSTSIKGVPLFDMSGWQEHLPKDFVAFFESNGRIRLVCDDGKALSIILGDGPPASSVVYGESVECVVGEDGELCAINLRGHFPIS